MSGRLSFVMMMLLCAAAARGQYYEQPAYEPSEARYLAAGVLWRDFAPTGSNTSPDSLRIHFATAMPALSFHQGMVDVLFAFGSYTLDGRSHSAVYFGTTLGNEFVISGRRSSSLIVPLHLALEFTKAESPGAERDHFNVAGLGLGGGLKYHYLSADIEFSGEITETAHYCLEGWSSGSGFSAVTAADVAFLFRGIRLLDGVALGYRFRYQTWSMDNARLNARVVDHGPYLGIMF